MSDSAKAPLLELSWTLHRQSPGRSVNGDRRAAREKARKANARRSQAIAALSTLIVIGGLVTLVLTSSGWPVVKETFFNVEVFKADFPDILRAFWLDIKMFVVIEVAVLILGLIVAVTRTSKAPVLFPFRILGALYCDFFRGIPVIILVYLFGFGIPALDLSGIPTDPILLGRIALTLAYSAYVAEVYRAGISSVHSGQMDAALAMGLTRTQSMRHVILPQAIRRVRPPLLNDFISLQKDVALVYVLGVTEAFRVAQVFSAFDLQLHATAGGPILYLAGHGADGPHPRSHHGEGADQRMTDTSISDAVIEIRGVTKAFGDRQVLGGIDMALRGARGGRPDRRIRLRQVDPAPLHRPAGRDRRR